jgi:tRNA threonylcarbamoyladenosine biosynthesis protein TsaB
VAVLILGIETATEQVSVAIGGHEGVIATFEVARGRRHTEILAPAIEFTCRQADVELGELGCIAVDVGPGLFTGMRVGLAAAKALAQALRIPMIGISSLDLLAFPNRHTDRVIVPVIDARRGEVYWAMYRQVPGGVQQVAAPTVGPVDELIADLLARSQDALCVGDGAIRYMEEILDGYHCEFGSTAHPSAAPLVQLAHARALREEWVSPREIEPIYLRLPDAQINWAVREARR